MDTAPQTAGTNTADTAPPAAATDAGASTLLTADAAPAPADTTPAATPDAAAPAATDKPADDAPQGAPEQYADFVAAEGVSFDTDTMTAFKDFAKSKNLSQEDAQKLIDIGTKNAQAQQQAFAAQIEQAQAQWAEASRIDKEFGGDKLTESMAVAKKALDTFGTPELKTMLTESGLGNHPEVIRAFYRMGKAVSEDRLVTGTTRPAADSTGQRLYAKSNMNP